MDNAHPPGAAAPHAGGIATGDWHTLAPAARGVFAWIAAFWATLIALGAGGIALLGADLPWALKGSGVAAIVLGCAAGGYALGVRSWRFTAWRLDALGLRVRRGRWFQSETLVPRSRVQHLDFERGPIERRYGLATLVIHTAGTRMHALRQAGFLEADALALREALIPEARRDGDSL